MEKLYGLTNPQKSIWATEEFYKGTNIENIAGLITFSVPVDFEKLNEAINLLIKTNDSFRLKFINDNGIIKQYVADFNPTSFEIVDIKSDEDLKKLEKSLSSTVFTVLNSFLFDFKMFRFPDNHGGVMLCMHHLISDAWASGIVINQIVDFYNKLISGEAIPSENVSLSYIDYIQSEQSYLESSKFERDKTFWNAMFESVPDSATIPGSISVRKELPTAKRKTFKISVETMDFINKFCKENKISPFNFFMGIYSIYISRVSNLNEFVIGTPVLNRSNIAEKNTTGMFISVVPFKIDVPSNKSFKEFSSEIGKDFFNIFRHQKYSYQLLLEDLRAKNAAVPNLFNIMLSYQNMRSNNQSSKTPFESQWLFNNNISDDIDIHFFDIDDTGVITVAYDYRTCKYSSEDILSLHARILNMINQVLENDSILLKDIEIVTSDEEEEILYKFNNTKMNYPKDKTVIQLFEDQVSKTPDNIAVIFEGEKLTYKELDDKANKLASYLISKNVQPNDIIAIYLDKSLEIIVSMLGILKANCAFLPLDINFPEERISFMLSDANVKFICSTCENNSLFSNYSVINVSLGNKELYSTPTVELPSFSNDSLMYVIYTSGSTGKPKGVMVTHKNIVRLVTNQNFITFGENEVMVQTGTISFDACIFEIFVPLLHGFKLYILKKDYLLDLDAFDHFIKENKISILFLTTGLFNKFGEIRPTIFENLKYLLTGGDVISSLAVKNIFEVAPNVKVVNCYGPTENGSYSTCFIISQENCNISPIPIGKPIANSTAYVVSRDNNLLPIGCIGELWVGGDGVSKGYLNRPDLTAEKFIPSPFNNDFIYKTGDLVRWNSDGTLDFIGRIDNQVKIRGFRIELNEINLKILEYSDIKNSITVIKELNNEKVICSYFCANVQIDIINLKNFLKKSLPYYEIPVFFTQLDSLPINANGKVDIKKLPEPKNVVIKKEIVLPRNDIDSSLIELIKQLLNIDTISIDDSFLNIGGDSLSAINLCTQIYTKFNAQLYVRDILEHPTIKELSDIIADRLTDKTSDVIPAVDKSDYYVTSSAQKRMYLSSEMAGENSVLYNVPGGIILDKAPDIAKLEKCFNLLIARHEALRTYFDIVDNNVVQKILDTVNFKLPVEKNRNFDDLHSIFEDFVKPFDLKQAPLFRAKFISFTNNKYALFIDMHHIISDGSSLAIFIDELCKLYNGETLSDLSITYKDFSVWENNKLKSPEFKESEDFWVNQFKDDVPVLNMPTNYQRPAAKSFEGDKVYSCISSELTEKLNSTCKDLGVTPYMLLLSTYYILLAKYSGQDDIIVGSPVVGRSMSQLYNIIGMFVNTLPMRAKINSNLSFKEFLNDVKNMCLGNFSHQDYPFDELVAQLDLPRDTSRNPLFDTLFTYQNNGNAEVNLDGINASYYIPDTKISKFDLSLEIIPENNMLNLSFEYCTKLFDKDFIENLSCHYLNILNAVLANSDAQLSTICMLSEEEKDTILYKFNDYKIDYPKDTTIVQLFEEQVEKVPDNIAVVFEDQKLTYRELNAKANSLANYLKQAGVGKNDIIPVLMNRSLDLIICMLAIMKSGAAYLPISTEMPSERIDYIISNSNAKLVLTKASQTLIYNSDIKTLDLEQFDFSKHNTKNLNTEIKPSDLLYIIYTSGSTGNPKGVKICHHNLVNFVYSFTSMYGNISSNDKLLASTNISFDVSIFEFFMTLLNGATLYLYNEPNINDIFNYCKTIIKNKITFLYIPPNILEEVYNILSSYTSVLINKMLLGVEPIKSATIKKYYSLNPDMRIVNAYGPTESTICSTAVVLDDKVLKDYKIIPIGRPLDNLNIFILDKDLQPVPVGVPGEIYISGDNVSKGYLNNKELTDKAFVPIPNLNCKLAYKTGDLAKWNNDGLISFIGRNDSQIKINGHRIELGEIEACVYLYPNIDKVVVLLDKNNKLICYFSSSKQITVSDLKAFMQRKLPGYFIPNFFVQVDNFKLTSNGKIDRKALKRIKVDSENSYEAPQTDYEKNLVKAFETVLGIDHVGITDNFFELGGDSLLAIKLQIEAFNMGLDLPYKDIFKYPTIKQLSENVSTASSPVLEDEYDYTEIDKLLKNNSFNRKVKLTRNKFKNVLLTGATGFLGSHILDSLLKNTRCNVYCLVRPKDNNDPQIRLLNTLRFYFGNKYDRQIFERIIVIEGDIKDYQLGLNDLYYEELGTNIDCVINSAAIVKHYGNIDTFNAINIQGAKNIIQFCNKFNCKLYHLSTLSVSGNIFETDSYKVADLSSDIIFNEQSLYIGQDLSNTYIYTKFIAERLILENILAGSLDAKIIRLGNITNRYSDGIFQINVSENAFLNRINSFLHLGCIPDYLADKYAEFSPVDLCADAIVKLAFSNNDFTVYHVYNNNHVTFRELLSMLNSLKVPMEIVDKDTFNKRIHAISKENSSKNILSGIINDFDENKNLSYNTNIKIQNNFTNKLLKTLYFRWPKINEKYMKKYIIYLKSIGYIK